MIFYRFLIGWTTQTSAQGQMIDESLWWGHPIGQYLALSSEEDRYTPVIKNLAELNLGHTYVNGWVCAYIVFD